MGIEGNDYCAGGGGNLVQFGRGTSDGSADLNITFPIPYSAVPVVFAWCPQNEERFCVRLGAGDLTSISGGTKAIFLGDSVPEVEYAWIAVGT